MDCGVTSMPRHVQLPARIQTHIRNQDSDSSSMSYDTVPMGDPIPSPRRWSPTYQPRRRSKQVPSLSFVPSPVMPRVESHDYSASMPRKAIDRNMACMSPFRSVRRMKEPFQLMLPSSPASLDDGPSTFAERPARSPRPWAARSLRTWRSDQNIKCDLGGLGLLPSPPISESRPSSAGPGSSYFEQNFRQPKAARVIPAEMPTDEVETQTDEMDQFAVEVTSPSSYSADDLVPSTTRMASDGSSQSKAHPSSDSKSQTRIHVTSVDEAEPDHAREGESVHDANPLAQGSHNKSSSIASPPSASSNMLPSGTSPRPQRPRTETVSSAASWVPSNFSYCERWLQGVPTDRMNNETAPTTELNNRRKFQIVENDPPLPELDIIPETKTVQAPVRYVVASKTKPKLVDISRQSPIPVQLPPPPTLLHQTLPTTPDQRGSEVSAFSPDTPLEASDSGYDTRDSSYSFDSYDERTPPDEDACTDPGSLTSSDSVGSTVICERPESENKERELPQLEIRSGSASPKASSPISPQSAGRASNKSEQNEDKPRLWHQDWNLDDHEWTLDELGRSVKDFPKNMLRLTSPAILFLRKSDEEPFIKPFRTIFPDVSENHLDCLCAALLARNYLLSLSTTHRKTALPPHTNSMVNSVPTKAYNTLGIQIPSSVPARSKDSLFASRSIELRPHLERIVDNILFAICGRSDPMLKAAVEVLAQVLETNA